ncbi:MAG: 4-hydroxythreonine-4-phosphate dehydrogenase PdxA [Akkermansiaceae bacterium]
MKKIGITLGDQAGIGPEIVAAALSDPRLAEWFPGDVEFRIVGERINAVLGQPDIASAQAALDALEESVRLVKAGEIDAIVTAPVAKEGLHKVGFDFPGQTEFFADRLKCDDHAMCLTGAKLTVALVTIHVPISTVSGSLKESEIVRVGNLLEKFCRQKRKSTGREGEPRIAVCGLNPHAGESGAFGSEDEEIVAPAIAKLNEAGGKVFSGPHPADTIFKPASEGEYDAVLCMYHDQGLIPLKLLDFATGVNTTLGLSHPRTSPDHGTAFDIAGKGLADHESMLHAIKLAVELAV